MNQFQNLRLLIDKIKNLEPNLKQALNCLRYFIFFSYIYLFLAHCPQIEGKKNHHYNVKQKAIFTCDFEPNTHICYCQFNINKVKSNLMVPLLAMPGDIVQPTNPFECLGNLDKIRPSHS